MFTKEDILKQLNSGKSIETIAAEITDALNEANDEYVAAQAVSAKRDKKIAIAKQFNDLIREYAELECPELASVMTMDEEDVDALIAAMDELFGVVKMASAMKDMFAEPRLYRSQSDTKAPKSDDDVLSDFISKICQ
jgi:ribosome-binding ATPase YchF (GTP1/OBG family)